MAERTSQPATEIGINATYATNARFLWNAAVPDKNSLDSSNSTTGLKGTDNTGTVGKYRTFGADYQMAWNVTMPTGAYTLVVVHVYPTASIGSATTVSTFSGNGLNVSPYTSGGGVYENYTHQGVAGSTNNQVTGVVGFNTVAWVEVFAYTGTTLRRYRKSGTGVETGGSETIGYSAPTNVIYLGSGTGANTQGVAAVMLIASDIGDAECELLRDNPWRMFADTGDTTAPVLTSPTGTQTGSTTANVGATTDEGSGTMWAVVTTSATQPSVAQIKAGQNHTGASAAWGGSQAISTTGAKTLGATGLTASTAYYGHVVHTDAAANDSNRVSSAEFTTAAGGDVTPPVITGPGAATGATSSANINENTTAVHTFTADETVTWDLNGGADVAKFSINPSTGALAFLVAPDFEAPTDTGTDNTYVVGVRATDTSTNATTQTCTVTVLNVNEAPLFSGSNIGTQSGTVGVALTPLDVSSRFTDPDAGDTRTFAPVGSWPAGVTVTSAGVIQGTPTTSGSFTGLTVRATDTGSLQVSSDTFTFNIAALYGFDFDTIAGAIFGTISGSLVSIGREAAVDVVVRVYDPADGALVAESPALTTDGNGRLERWGDVGLADATTYDLVFKRDSDGAIACARMATT